MLNKKIEAVMNEQIQKEFYSAYLYMSMSAYCESINYSGFAHWMRLQYEEETVHALRLFDYLNDRGGKVELKSIDKPPTDFKSPQNVFGDVLAHEQEITESIHKLYALAVEENDYPTQVEMQWFITEQVEEEKTANNIVQQLKLAGGDNTALLMLDRALGSRTADNSAN